MSNLTQLPRLLEYRNPGYINDTDALDFSFYSTSFGFAGNKILDSIKRLETSVEEIVEKQEIFKTIFENGDLADEIARLTVSQDIPNSYYTLKNYLSEGTSFYDTLKNCIRLIDGWENVASPRLVKARESLEKLLELEEGEQELMQAISEEARKCHKFVGNLTIREQSYRRETLNSESYGFRVYPIRDSDHETIGKTPDPIKRDIIDYIKKNINHRTDDWKDLDTLGLVVDYTYDDKGLEVGIRLDRDRTQLTKEAWENAGEIGRFVDNHFTKPYVKLKTRNSWLGNLYEKIRYRFRLRSERKQKKKFVERARQNAIERKVIEYEAKIGEFSGRIPSENSKAVFQEEILGGILQRHSEELNRYKSARSELSEFLSTWRDYYHVARYFMQKSREGYPVTFPNIKEARERKLEIKDLYPIRLVNKQDSRQEDIIPNDVACNGKPNVITGPNAGGKSIYIVSLNDAILMAQAGMPLLASHADMSVKDALFVHFIKDGDAKIGESTFENAMTRFKELFTEIPNYKNPHITADELAAGTDPQSAYDVSERITKALAGISSRASSYVVTQFRDVAETAEKDYAANTLTFDKYKIMPGIGDAKGLELAERIGLTQDFVDDIISQCKV